MTLTRHAHDALVGLDHAADAKPQRRLRPRPSAIAVLAAIALASAMSSCASSSDTPTATTSQEPTPPPGPVASYPDSAWMGKSLHVHAETEDGWVYDGEFGIEVPTVEFGKDISTSPPGQAVLTSFVSGGGSSGCWGTIPTDNGERIGPDLCVHGPELIFPFDDFKSLNVPDTAEVYWQDLKAGCRVDEMAGPEYLACGPLNSGQSKTYDLPEETVDSFLADVKHIKPGVRVQVGEDMLEFNSDGTLTRYPLQSSYMGPTEQPANPWYDHQASYKASIS